MPVRHFTNHCSRQAQPYLNRARRPLLLGAAAPAFDLRRQDLLTSTPEPPFEVYGAPQRFAPGWPHARLRPHVLTRPEAVRAALIGRLHQRDDGEWLAELLIDLEEDDEPARLRLVAALRGE